MKINTPNIDSSWYEALKNQFDADYFGELKSFLVEEKSHYRVYPPGSLIFNAFNLTPLPDVKVVILGQDPYHGAGQAHGLAFSVPAGVAFPPSLRNIFKELQTDIGINVPYTGSLDGWAKQGVLLLNTTLTVREATPMSHAGHGWEIFTDAAIKAVSDNNNNVVFMLWGSHAGSKKPLIDGSKHCILQAPHPSPLSASRGFFGCKHFSKANAYLTQHGKTAIDWGMTNYDQRL